MESAADRRLFWGTASVIVVADIVSKLVAESMLSRRLPVSVIGVRPAASRTGMLSRAALMMPFIALAVPTVTCTITAAGFPAMR